MEVDVDVLVLVEDELDDDVELDELVDVEVDDDVELEVLVDEDVLVDDVVDELVDEVVDDDVLDEELLDDVLLDVLDDVVVELDVLDDVELDVLDEVELDVLLLDDEDEELDELEVLVEVDEVVVVLGGGGRPITGMRAARHLAVVPGTVPAIDVQSPLVLLSQLTTVPTSTMPSLSVSMQRMDRLSMFRSVFTFCSMSPHVSAAVSPW